MKAWEIHYIDSDGIQRMEVVASIRKPSPERALKLAQIDDLENIQLSEVIIQELVIYGEHGNRYIATLEEA